MKRITLFKRVSLHAGETIVDDDFNPTGYTFSLSKQGYAQAYCKKLRTKTPLHRIIINAQNGELVDHINRVRLDNRKSNLRLVTNSQNQWNKRINKNNKSGFKGVSFHAKRRKWRAAIAHTSKRIELGLFDTKQEAAIAYNNKAMELFKEFCCLNEVTTCVK